MDRKRTGLSLLALTCLIAGLLGGTAAAGPKPKPTTSGSTTTAQAIWTNFKSAGSDSTFGYTQTMTYSFDEDVAAAAYAGPTVLQPTINCTGGGTGTFNNTGLPQPCNPVGDPGGWSEPPAPSFSVPAGDKCTFWSGGDLSTVTKTATTASKPGTNGGTWTATYTYTWGGNAVGSDDPADDDDGGSSTVGVGAWTGVEGDGAAVMFTGQIAGLSAQKNSKGEIKYSFSLLNGDGSPRISGVVVRAYDTKDSATLEDDVLLDAYPVASSVVDAWDELAGTATEGFSEFSVGPGFGLSYLMGSNGATGILTTGDARDILNGLVANVMGTTSTYDVFAGNNDGGSTGAALAYLQLSATRIALTEGSFRVTLTANVKDIASGATATLTVEQTGLRVVGLEGCG